MFYRGEIGLNLFEISDIISALAAVIYSWIGITVILERFTHSAVMMACVIRLRTFTYFSFPASVYSKMLYCIICVSADLNVLSGSRWVVIWFSIIFFILPLSFSFFISNSSPLPCLWCWQCYTTIRQRFVNVFHQLHLCMFVCHCHSYVSSGGSHYSWCRNYKLSSKDDSSLISQFFFSISSLLKFLEEIRVIIYA